MKFQSNIGARCPCLSAANICVLSDAEGLLTKEGLPSEARPSKRFRRRSLLLMKAGLPSEVLLTKEGKENLKQKPLEIQLSKGF